MRSKLEICKSKKDKSFQMNLNIKFLNKIDSKETYLSLQRRLIDDEQPVASTRAAFGWRQYYSLDDIYEWLDQMLRRFPNELTSYNIGKTFEKRTIRGIKFSRQPERVL